MYIKTPEEDKRMLRAMDMVERGAPFTKAAEDCRVPYTTLYQRFHKEGRTKPEVAAVPVNTRSKYEHEAERLYYALTPGGRADHLAKAFIRGKL